MSYFVTGATGFIGRHLVERLLERRDGDIYVLVREGSKEKLDALIERFRTRSADERRGIPGLQPKRAEVILAGACIARTVLAKLGAESVTVSDRGLRHGLLVERFEA